MLPWRISVSCLSINHPRCHFVVTALSLPSSADEQFGFGLYEGEDGHPYDMLQASLANPSLLTKNKIPPQYHEALTSIVKHRLSSNPVKVEAEINLTCFGVDGVEALKTALLTARQHGTEDTPISVYVKASPVYVLTATHLDKSVAVDLLNKAIEAIRAKISEFPSGALEVKTAPKAVTV